jgi:uncharacterized protein (DUF2252 family)
MARNFRTKVNGPIPAVELIIQHNEGREPERLAIKYAIMRANPFAFLRGTSHLFHKRLVDAGIAPEGPPVWSSGDLHLENYGSYLGDNGLAYFDVNDFDAAMLAPAPWDVLRLVTSLLIAAPTLHLKRPEIDDLARAAFETWRDTLGSGKAGWVERRTAEGVIGELLTGLRKRDEIAFLDSRSKVKKGVRALKDQGTKMLPVSDKDKQRLGKWLLASADGRRERGFFTLIDAARRVAGVASLGATRFVLLVEGTGSPDGNLLLDLKSAQPSAAAPYSPCVQPDWPSKAHRIVEIQKRCEAVPPDFLQAVSYAGEPCILKQLQPSQDRLDLVSISRQPAQFGAAMHSMAQISAWAHLRSSGRQGAANADALIAFADVRGFGKRLLETAHRMEDFVLADWKDFCAAYDAGRLGLAVKAEAPSHVE